MPRLHLRYGIVKGAELEIGAAVRAAIAEHDLTYAELLGILTTVQQNWIRYMLRDERHPGTDDIKADEACDEHCRHESGDQL